MVSHINIVENLVSENNRKSDDTRLWKNNGVQYFNYHVGQNEDVILENDDENREKVRKKFKMKRIYCRNNKSFLQSKLKCANIGKAC